MADSDPLEPTGDPALTGLETVPAQAVPRAGGPALPGSGRGAGRPLTLETDLLGPLTLPDGAARAAELAELSRRAALYATRARGDGTRRAYRTAWRQYETGAAHVRRGRSSVPLPAITAQFR